MMAEQLPVTTIIKKAAEKARCSRVRYSEKNIPTVLSNVCVFVTFGDFLSNTVLSSLLLKRFREESRGSKYFIVISWKGNQGLFPWADEYWEYESPNLYNKVNGFDNSSEEVVGLHRVLNTFFEEVLDYKVLEMFYKNGIQKEFFDRYKHIKVYMPSIPSSAILPNDFNRRLSYPGAKLVIYPVLNFQYWKNGRLEKERSSKDFWVALVKRLLNEGITPVIYQNNLTYDLSPDFTDKCLYFTDSDVLKVLSMMRASGCVLDLFSDISKLAIIARCPYVVCTERAIFNFRKDYEIEDLCGRNLPKQYYWSLPAFCDEINKLHWNDSLFDVIITKIISLIDNSNRESWPSPTETNEIVPYSLVRDMKKKKMGMKFIKVPKY